jgi:hypothetical protein
LPNTKKKKRPSDSPKPALDSAPKPPSGKCEVCGDPVSGNPSEQLCWVCRRLKISAWRDSESQSAIQE